MQFVKDYLTLSENVSSFCRFQGLDQKPLMEEAIVGFPDACKCT
jgi:hypothetical protein